MSIRKFNQPALVAWVNILLGKQRVFGVQAKADHFAYGPLSRGEDLRLDFDVTILPPKKYFQPQKEDLLEFNAQGEYTSLLEPEPFVLFGVHPYDVIAIAQMDTIFSTDNLDIHYLTRRQNATIVACDVQKPSENVFAGCLNTVTAKDGFDLLLTNIGESYLAEAKTPKGELLLADLPGGLAAGNSDLAKREQIWKANTGLLRKHTLKCSPQELPGILAKAYDAPVWAEKARLCFSCGSCNLVCPTCYCFDVQDRVNWDLHSGMRTRTWDGCLLTNFAAVAGGHNFRSSRADRYRHRFYRKGKYVAEVLNQIACVGCGRCISACVSKIANPVEVFNQLL